MQQILEPSLLVAYTLEEALLRIELTTYGHPGIFFFEFTIENRTCDVLPFSRRTSNYIDGIHNQDKKACEMLRIVFCPGVYLY